jgi:predicted DNA-binding transcriptional regulator YafY
MPKRPDTKETLLLALELLRHIPRGRAVTAKYLYERLADSDLARDLRTIQRQLEMLTGYFNIECDDSRKPYRYRWSERARGFSIPTLTQQQSLLLMLAEQHLKNLLPVRLMKTMDGFFSQARRNLDPHTNTKQEREWLSKVRVVRETQPLLPPKINPGIFETVSNALYNNNWLSVDYKNSAGNQATHEIMPLGLAQQGPRLYLVCRFKGFDNERSLALHRMLSAKASTFTFDRPKDFDLQRYDDDGRFGFGEGKRIRLTFHIDKEAGAHLIETPLSKDQKVKELEDHYEISATVVDSAQLEWWLRGFGEQVTGIRRRQAF